MFKWLARIAFIVPSTALLCLTVYCSVQFWEPILTHGDPGAFTIAKLAGVVIDLVLLMVSAVLLAAYAGEVGNFLRWLWRSAEWTSGAQVDRRSWRE